MSKDLFEARSKTGFQTDIKSAHFEIYLAGGAIECERRRGNSGPWGETENVRCGNGLAACWDPSSSSSTIEHEDYDALPSRFPHI